MIQRKLPLSIHLFFLVFFYCQMGVAHELCPSIQQEKIQNIIPVFDSFIISFLRKVKAPGSVVAVVGPREVYFLKAYGVKKCGQSDPLTTKTLFQLGSVSKPLTATLVGILQAEHKLSIEAPVTTYLTDFKLQDQRRPLLFKHLLSHTSGVPSNGFNALIESFPERNKLYKEAQDTPLLAPPGEHFDYHNVMFGLTEDVLVAIMNQSFKKLLQENLFKPLKMPLACVGFESFKEAPHRAFPHIADAKGKILPRKIYSQAYYAVTPAGGINASMEDLIPFLQAHLGGFPEVLSADTLRLLHTSQIMEDHPPKWLKGDKPIRKTGYALGWRWMDYGDQRILFHGGWVGGFRNMVAFLPAHQIGVIILQNAETRLPLKAALKFFDLYLQTP